jgi:hypothetical protein
MGKINVGLGTALCELVQRSDRDIPVSGLFLKLLCGDVQPTAELVRWCSDRNVEVQRTGGLEVTFRKADGIPRRGDRALAECAGELFDL